MPPLRLAILLDDLSVPLWVNNALESLASFKEVDICLYIVNKDSGKGRKGSPYLMYRLLRYLDKKILKTGTDPFCRVKAQVPESSVLHIMPVRTMYSDRFPDCVIRKIRESSIDIILRFGFRILRGEILSVAKWGILSLHHGCTREYRGGPPAFWEVVNRAPITTVTLQRLTEELDGGQIIAEAHLRTDRISFYRNQAKLYWAGQELILSKIREIAGQGPEGFFGGLSIQRNIKSFYSQRLYKNPGTYSSIRILLNWSLVNIKRKINDLLYVNQWYLLISVKNSFYHSFHRFKSIRPGADRIWADPFVIFKEGSYYLFFEEKKFNASKAHISFIIINETGDVVSAPQVALQEKFHLSYPFVFQYEGGFYMVPESAETGELYLFRSFGFPLEWKKIRTLLSDLKVYDATIHLHKGVWYLFCTAKEDDKLSSDAYLHIFFTSDIFNVPFVAHPANPVYRDVRCSRPAGKIFMHEGRIFRPAQICAPDYGSGITIFEIIELTPELFEEKESEILFPGWQKGIKAMHTFNREGDVAVIDVQQRRFRWG